jgi:hypothetical protein
VFLNVTLVPGPDQVVVRFTGEADLSTSPVIAEALGRAAGRALRGGGDPRGQY